jgi:hypothetical protein
MFPRNWTASLFVAVALLLLVSDAALARLSAPAPVVSTSTEDEGTIAVRLHACPAHMRPLDFDAAACPLNPDAANLQVAASSGGANRRDLSDATPEGDALAWGGLPFAEYALQVRDFAPGYDRYLIPGRSGLNISPDFGYTASPNEGYLLPLDATHPSYLLDVYVFRAYESAGALRLNVRLWQCPPGIAAAPDMRGHSCVALSAPPAGFDLQVAGEGVGDPLQLAQAAADDDGDLGWDDVPGGEYRVTARLPPDMPRYAVRSYDPGVRVQLLSDNSGYALVFLLEAGALPAPSEATLDVYLLH